MSYVFLFSLLVTLAAPAVAGPATKPNKTVQDPIGIYSNMNRSEETGDCGGYTVWLRRENGKIAGELAVFEGGCKEYRKRLFDVTHAAETGALSFKVITDQERYVTSFSGKLESGALSGDMSVTDSLNAERPPYGQHRVVLKKR